VTTTAAPPVTRRSNLRIMLVVLVAVLLLLPVATWVFPDQKWITNSRLFSFTQMFMLVSLASNWNLTGGFTGYIDFGHAVFFGIGAYGTGILMNEAWPFLPAMLGGALFAATFAILIGYPTLRLKGPYFSIAMLGTFVAMREIIRVAKPLTGGGVGLTLPPYLNRPLFYYATLGLAIVVIAIMWWIRRSEFGATLIAIREDEVGAEMRGINTTLNKIVAFTIAGFLTGIVGGLWAYQNTFIDPDIVFIESRTVELVIMSMLGGLGTVAGPPIGAAVIYWLRDIVWANFLQYHLLVEGLLMILIVLYVPQGIVGKLGDRSGTTVWRIWRRRDDEPPDGEAS
jgi:branched-chain amino acid transport system permease protein